MENRYSLQLDVNRPIIQLDNLFPGCTALIDTGAVIPVWTKSVELLRALGAKLYKENVPFSGFGGETKGDLYKLDFAFGDFVYPGLPVVVHEDNNIPGFFIFSATMFQNMVYTIDDIRKEFVVKAEDNQVCRNLKISTSNGKTVVLMNQ